jgi:site-specific recombinase XerC
MAVVAARPVLEDVRAEIPRFLTHLQAEHKSPRTVESYVDSANQLGTFLAANGMPIHAPAIRREHVEAYLVDLAARGRSPATAALRYRSLRVFFGWLVDEDVVSVSPMAKMSAPSAPIQPVPVLGKDEIRRMLRATSGKTFDDRRDAALVLIYYSTGARLSEIANITTADVRKLALGGGEVTVLGKGGSHRTIRFGSTTQRALDQYDRLRSRHKAARSEWLWLGKRGRLEPRGIVQAMRRRAAQAGIVDFHAHRLRHSKAHEWLAKGGLEGDLMQIMGWQSRTMLTRYAASAASERANAAQSRLDPADEL